MTAEEKVRARQAEAAHRDYQKWLARQAKVQAAADAKAIKDADKAKARAAKEAAKAKRTTEKERKAQQRADFLESRNHTEESLAAQQAENRAKWEAKKAAAIAAGTYESREDRQRAIDLAADKAQRFPDTIDELRALGTPLADAAARHTLARLIEKWEFGDFNVPAGNPSNPRPVVRECLTLYQDQVCLGLGVDKARFLPDDTDIGYHPTPHYVPPVLSDLSPECRQEALRVIAETRAEYAADGSPGLHETGLAKRMAPWVLAAVRGLNTYNIIRKEIT